MEMIDTNEFEKQEAQTKPVIETKPKVNSSKPNYDFFPIEGLPSKGAFYQEDVKICGRRLYVPEIKKLGQLNATNFNFIVEEILSNAIRGVDVDDILDSDKLYLIFWLRANTYREPNYETDFECPNCEQVSTFTFSLDNLNIKLFNGSFDSSIKLIVSGDELTLKHLTIKDKRRQVSFKKKNEQFIKKVDDEDLDIASSIVSINDEEVSLLEKYNYVSKLDPDDYAYLTSYIEDNSFGVSYAMTVKCNKCGGESQSGVTFRREFFIPKYQFRKDSGNGISD